MRLPQVILTATAVLTASAATALAQLPLAPRATTGQTVTPVFEGWYRNPDSTFSLSFGYYNRNTGEALDIPIGADNLIVPGAANQGQPDRFEPRRHWGVFAVKVPAGFDPTARVTWTLKVRGETFAIPGSLHPDWEIDALAGEAGSGNTPPMLTFSSGETAQGPAGATVGPLTATVGQPLVITLTARDDGRLSGSVATAGRSNVPVTLAWFKHQGPGRVTFDPASPRAGATDGVATAQATFSRPGEYVLRVRANDASGVSGAGHAQCCWTNGFVRVVVSP